jgi:4-diphosphocytidyl-2-C-methyl-D-erythritol kinase
MKLEAHAKVNLFLHVVGRFRNGYHKVETVFQPLKIGDVVEVKKVLKGVEVTSNDKSIPLDERNSAFKAAVKLAERVGVDLSETGVRIHIVKRIPSAGGLGGSAVDAAPVLIILNKMWKAGLSVEELVEIAGSVAVDAPQALIPRVTVGSGTGAKVRVVPSRLGKCFVLLVNPVGEYYPGKAKSAYLYSKLDEIKIKHEKSLKKLLKSIERGSWVEASRSYENDFELVVFRDYPVIERVKKEVGETKPVYLGMSGAGSVVFGFYPTKSEALKAERFIKKKFKCWTLVTETL